MLKKIIVDSIYDEFNADFSTNCSIVSVPNLLNVDGNEILLTFDREKHSVSRRANNTCFEYDPKKNSYAFSDFNRKFFIKTCDDDNGEIFIHYHDNDVKQKITEQKITDDNLTKSAKECLVFLKSVSLVELKMYYQTFTQSITQEKEAI